MEVDCWTVDWWHSINQKNEKSLPRKLSAVWRDFCEYGNEMWWGWRMSMDIISDVNFKSMALNERGQANKLIFFITIPNT